MSGLINVFGAFLSAAWKGSPQNEEKNSKLKEKLSASVSQNQTRINAYIDEYRNATLASSNQTLSSDVDKKVYEVGAAYKLFNLFYKFFTLDSSLFKKPRILQIESVKNNISSSSLDLNQLANLVKDSSNKNIGELATASSDQSFISDFSELISVTANQISVTANQIYAIINPIAFWNYPPKEELINRLKAPVDLNQTRIEIYKKEWENTTRSNLATNSSESVDKNFNKTDFEEFFKNSNMKSNSEALLSNDFYKAASRTAALILVLAPVLYLAYNNIRKAQRGDDLKINETRRNNILKKFKTLSKKALIHDRFEKIQKENTQIKESKQVGEPIESQVSVSQINIQKPHSLEESKVNILKAKSSASSNQFLSAFSDLKKLFDPNNEPLSVSRIYKFIVL